MLSEDQQQRSETPQETPHHISEKHFVTISQLSSLPNAKYEKHDTTVSSVSTAACRIVFIDNK